MDLKIERVRSFNLLILFLISIFLILVIMTAMLFLSSSLTKETPIASTIAAALLLLFCFPISTLLYYNDTNAIAKKLFMSLSLTFLLLSVSGITWYLIPEAFSLNFFMYIGMLTMILSYLPITYTLIGLYKLQNNNINKIIKSFITYVMAAFLILFIIFVITNIVKAQDTFSVIIFSLSIAFDLIIICVSIMLILINMGTHLRYLLSIVFGFYSICFIGDVLNFFDYLNLYSSTINNQYFYDAMLLFASGSLMIYALSNIKITTIEEVNKKLKDTTLVVEDLIMQSPDLMCMCDPDGNIIKSNELFTEAFNIKSSNNIFNLNIDSNIIESLNNVKNGKMVHVDTVNILSNTNNEKFYSVTLYPTYTSDRKISNYIFIAEDITIRINAEKALKKANDELENRVIERTTELSKLNVTLQNEIHEHMIDEEKIKASLKEKEVLLKEVHHRVKNNMQIISSMLGLQSTYVKNEYFNDVLKDCQNRIKSMALIHEKLYQSDNMARIIISEYVDTLLSYLKNSYTSNNISINYKMLKNISFNLDIAIPLGLIINELITNSLKHAFLKDKQGNIDLSINKIDENTYMLMIKDNGIGLPNNFDINNTNTLGLQLVKVLVEQINGILEINNDNGATFKITFKIY